MKPLMNQSVTTVQTNVVTKVVILILNALCGVTIYCLFGLRSIRPELSDLMLMLSGLFVAIMLVTWVAWPYKAGENQLTEHYDNDELKARRLKLYEKIHSKNSL